MEIRLQEFIRKTIVEINSGMPDAFVIDETIDFEVPVTTSTSKSGGLEIKVLTGEISKANFCGHILLNKKTWVNF